MRRVSAEGPVDAKIALVGECPARREVELGRPFMGRAGKVLDEGLRFASVDRSACFVTNVVDVRAPGDKFAAFDAATVARGVERLHAELAALPCLEVVVALGAHPLEALVGNLPEPSITQWRGSVFPWGCAPVSARSYMAGLLPQPGARIVASLHPAAVARQFSWHPLLVNDLKRAASVVNKTWRAAPERAWFFGADAVAYLDQFVDKVIKQERCVSVDTEMSYVIGLAGEDDVLVFPWVEEAGPALKRLFESPHVLKIAHNANHDWTFFRTRLALNVLPPFVDTMGLLHATHHSQSLSLSPGLASRYTPYPYHKWMSNEDELRYCGLDVCVAYDGYWNVIREVTNTGKLPVVVHDNALQQHLLEMQWRGVRVDSLKRQAALRLAESEYADGLARVRALAAPVIARRIKSFHKPHLFQAVRMCECCGGGATQRLACWRCSGLPTKPVKKADWPASFVAETAALLGVRKPTIGDLRSRLTTCRTCAGTGRVRSWLPFNPDSSDQVADLIYRGLGLPARSYKGTETVRVDQLAGLMADPLVAGIVELSKLGTDIVTLQRLAPDTDGRLHCVFDPWGTDSGRVASKEGLLQVGTNLQNIPKKHRNVIVADEGEMFYAPDKAQIEARCVAVLSKDAGLMNAFTKPIEWPGHPKHGVVDSHTYVQQMVTRLGVELTRDQCKRLTYAAMYGVSAGQLAVELTAEAERRGGGRVSTEQAAAALAAFYRAFSGVATWQQDVVRQVMATRVLTSPTGRVFEWPGYVVDPRTRDISHAVAKQAWSRQPQDMAAFVLAKGLNNLVVKAPWIKPVVHVHDELVLSVPSNRLGEAREIIQACMDLEEWGMAFPTDVGDPAPNWRCAKGVHDGVPCRDCGKEA